MLFTLLAERYERRSVMVTSNLVFSQWDRIFRDQMATAAAIDRLVHHAVVIEFDVPSYRTDRSRLGSGPSGDTPSVPRLRLQLWALRPGLDGGVPAVHDVSRHRQNSRREPAKIVDAEQGPPATRPAAGWIRAPLFPSPPPRGSAKW